MKKLIILLVAGLLWAASARAQGCMEPSGDEGVQVIGFIQPQFQYDFLGNDKLTGDLMDSSSFYFNRARLGVMGSIPYDFSYYVMMEFSPTLNGGKTPKPPFLLDAFVSYNRFAPYVKVAVGQFKAPFGQELLTPCHQLNTIRRSMVVENLVHPWRDMGLMFSGGTGDLKILGVNTTNFFGYQLAFMNGTGVNQFDNNRNKSIVARLTVHPVEFLTLGASYRYGTNPPQADGVTQEDTKKRFGFDADINFKGFRIQGEYVHGTDEGSYTTGGGCGGETETVLGSIKRQGFFVQAMYMTPWRLQPIFRFERYDPNLDMGASDAALTSAFGVHNIMTYGINYFFNDKVRLQINYLYQAEETAKLEVPNDGIIAQFQIVF